MVKITMYISGDACSYRSYLDYLGFQKDGLL